MPVQNAYTPGSAIFCFLGTMRQTLDIQFGGSRLLVDCLGDAAVWLGDFLFGAMASATAAGAASGGILTVESEAERGNIICRQGDSLFYLGESQGNAARKIMDRTITDLATDSRGGMLFHAAAVRYHGYVLIFPGISGTGKSTLAAWLCRNGFEYLTDELVFVPLDGSALETFQRPLNIKTRGLPVIRSFMNFEDQANNRIVGGLATLISQQLFNPGVPEKDDRVRIIFPSYAPSNSLAVEGLSRAKCTQSLIGNFVNARNLPAHGFPDVSRFSARAPGYVLSYPDFDGVIDLLHQHVLQEE